MVQQLGKEEMQVLELPSVQQTFTWPTRHSQESNLVPAVKLELSFLSGRKLKQSWLEYFY